MLITSMAASKLPQFPSNARMDVDKVLNDMSKDFNDVFNSLWTAKTTRRVVLPVDAEEAPRWLQDETSYTCNLEVPGFSKDTLQAGIEGGQLKVIGTKDARTVTYTLSPPEGQSFDTDDGLPRLHVQDGLLTVYVPRVPSTTKRTIAID